MEFRFVRSNKKTAMILKYNNLKWYFFRVINCFIFEIYIPISKEKAKVICRSFKWDLNMFH